MKKLPFNLDRLLAEKPADQKTALPVEMELHELELATVTGSGDGCEWDCDDFHHHRHHRRHHRHHEHHEHW